MDDAYNQYASQARRKNRSTSNLHRLTLAPLTTRFPLPDDADADDDDMGRVLITPPSRRTTSYLQGRSAPTTPGLISRSPVLPHARSREGARPLNTSEGGPIQKSKSTTQLAAALATPSKAAAAAAGMAASRRAKSGYATPTSSARRRRDEPTPGHQGDSDWMLRAGALLSTEARESKGQAWLVSRESSTSLAGMHDPEAEAFEMELARERALASRKASRRGSIQADDEGELPDSSSRGSRRGSRRSSRSGSRPASMVRLMTCLEKQQAEPDYFSHRGSGHEHGPTPGPDFVNLDETLEAMEEDTSREDEITVRKLVKKGRSGPGAWVTGLFGFTLFSVSENEEPSDGEEDEEEEEEDEEEEKDGDKIRGPGGRGSGGAAIRHFEGVTSMPEERIPPPVADEGGWRDAAWLLSVAAKVLL